MSRQEAAVEKYNKLMSTMSQAKEQWAADEGLDDHHDHLLSQAIELAIEQGRGWSPGEKEAYLETILDDDFISPMFATTTEEVEKSGLQDAFTSLIYDGESPTSLMLTFKKKGNEAFANGKRNVVQNKQYFRDAINHYAESLSWAQRIQPLMPGDLAQADTYEETYTEEQLNELKSTLHSNIAFMHMQLMNWGHARDESKKALKFDQKNVKAWYRLAKSCQMLQLWEIAGDAIDSGLAVETDNKDLMKLQKQIDEKVRKVRSLRQQRERARAERSAQVKEVWKHCKERNIKLGRLPLVNSVSDDDADDREESRWHHHLPHSGQLPARIDSDWSWPCLFLYPSHNQSDFIKSFGESEMMALRLAEMFPEKESPDDHTALAWDYDDEFVCSNLAIYFEVHSSEENGPVYPESVQLLSDQGSCMRFYETSRALKGDEGADIANIVRLVERKRLLKQQGAWKKVHGSLWAKPDLSPVVRVHPAMSLGDVLTDDRMIVPNFIVTLFVLPESHPAHEAFLKTHKCVAILQPKGLG